MRAECEGTKAKIGTLWGQFLKSFREITLILEAKNVTMRRARGEERTKTIHVEGRSFWAQSFHHKSSSMCECSNSLSKKKPSAIQKSPKKIQTNSWGQLFSSKIPTNRISIPNKLGAFCANSMAAQRPTGPASSPQLHHQKKSEDSGLVGWQFARVSP